MRGLLLTLALVSAAGAAGCITGQDGSPILDARIVPGVTTKEEVLRLLGPPSDFRIEGELIVLGFNFLETNGTGYGVGAVGIGFDLEQTHRGLDVVEVHIGPDRIVRSVRVAGVPKQTPLTP